jgi:hypothetical protein
VILLRCPQVDAADVPAWKDLLHEDRWAVLKAPDPTQTPEHLQAQDWRQRAAALEAQMAADSSSQLSQL